MKPNLRFPLFFAGTAFLCWMLLRLALWWHFAPTEAGASATVKLLVVGMHVDLAWALIGSAVLIGVSAFFATLFAVVPVLLLRFFRI